MREVPARSEPCYAGYGGSSQSADAAATGLHPRPTELVGNIFSHRAQVWVYLPGHTLRGRR